MGFKDELLEKILAIPGVVTVNIVHDEILVECKEEDRGAVIPLVEDVLQEEIKKAIEERFEMTLSEAEENECPLDPTTCGDTCDPCVARR